MSARDWQPGDRAYVEVEVLRTVDEDSVTARIAGRLGWVLAAPTADLLPVPQADEDTIERAAKIAWANSDLLPSARIPDLIEDLWSHDLDDEQRAIWLDIARALAAANLLASPVQPGPTLHELVDETYEPEGVGIWWTNWAAADPAKRRSMEAIVGYRDAVQPGRSEAEIKAALTSMLTTQRDWSAATFGPGDRLAGVLDHIGKELDEIRESPKDAMEWIDVVILAFDGAWRAGHEPAEIAAALLAKYAKNRARTWPDWRTMPADKAIEHVRVADTTDTEGGK